MTQLAQRLGLNLTNAFVSDAESLADILQRPLTTIHETEAVLQNTTFTRCQGLEMSSTSLRSMVSDAASAGAVDLLVLDEVAELKTADQILAMTYGGAISASAHWLVPRLRIIGVLERALVVRRPVRLLTPQHKAMLVASDAIGVVERRAQVGAGIEISFAARRIPFVVGVSRGWSNPHVSASE